MKYTTILIISLLSLTFEIKTKMSKKVQKSKQTYANEITVESVNFVENCMLIDSSYYFLLDISQTSSDYPLTITGKITLEQEDDSSVSATCNCGALQGSSILNCTLSSDLVSETKYSSLNQKNFRVAKLDDTTFSCTKIGSDTAETCKLNGFDYDDTVTFNTLYDILSTEQNNTYVINYGNSTEGQITVNFDTFVMGEGPDITLDGTVIKKCEETAYEDNEDEGQYIKCTITKEQFPVDNYASYQVIVMNQCGYEEYPGITVVINNFGKWINIGFSLFMLLALF